MGINSLQSWKKAVKLTQELLRLVKKLDLKLEISMQLLECFKFANYAKKGLGLFRVPDPNIFKREALEYCQNFGDSSMYLCTYNKTKLSVRKYVRAFY